jgi:hypothetical protein
MIVEHDKKTGSVKFIFSWKEIFTLILKKELWFDKDVYKGALNYFAAPVLTNLHNKLYENQDIKSDNEK